MATEVRVAGFDVACRNPEELRLLAEEIFEAREYAFDCDAGAPRILDAGAHVGLAALDFMRRFPGARLTCFEPDAGNCALLRHNLARHGFADVEVVEAALCGHDGEVAVYGEVEGDAPWTWDLSIQPDMWDKGEQQTRRVPAARLSRWLDAPVDFLKLDVEGAEEAVLAECAGRLGVVRAACVEVHPGRRRDGRSAVDEERIADLLRAAGFRLDVLRWPHKRPYLLQARRA